MGFPKFKAMAQSKNTSWQLRAIMNTVYEFPIMLYDTTSMLFYFISFLSVFFFFFEANFRIAGADHKPLNCSQEIWHMMDCLLQKKKKRHCNFKYHHNFKSQFERHITERHITVVLLFDKHVILSLPHHISVG